MMTRSTIALISAILMLAIAAWESSITSYPTAFNQLWENIRHIDYTVAFNQLWEIIEANKLTVAATVVNAAADRCRSARTLCRSQV
jgi:hypothetical protein